MSAVPRFYVERDLAAGAALDLPEAAAHHALRVLRLRAGAPLVLFNGRGGEYEARLVRDDRAARVEIDAHAAIERESPLRVTLAQALVANDKLDWVVEKATELGAAAVLVFGALRSVVRLDGERLRRRERHWRDIATAACC